MLARELFAECASSSDISSKNQSAGVEQGMTCKREKYVRSAGQDSRLFSEGLLQSLIEGENFCIRLAVPVFGTAACVKQQCTQRELWDACIARLGTS